MTSSSPYRLIFYSEVETERHLVETGLQGEPYSLVCCASPAELAALDPADCRPSVLFYQLSDPCQGLPPLPSNILELRQHKRLVVMAVLPQASPASEEELNALYRAGVVDIVYSPVHLATLKTAFRVWIGRLLT